MKFVVGFIFASFFCIANSAFADSNYAGIMASNGCVNCHGAEGRGTTIGNIPPLIGRSEKFLAAAMEGYKEGTLKGTVMNRVMKNFDKGKIVVLAIYFSSIK